MLPAGSILQNRYLIQSLLGQGGMSRVYLADATHLGTRVAIKENLQPSHEACVQFEREAKILARLSHPNIPRVIDHFVDGQTGRQYLVMDYIGGEDLDSIIKRQGSLSEETALAWIQQILDALAYLHSQTPPVIHRDVKPSNIKITPQGKAVLVDFGISKLYDPQLTMMGARAVTPDGTRSAAFGYSAPEQYRGATSPQSDIYSLGATWYTLVTAHIPPNAMLLENGLATLTPPRALNPALSAWSEELILKAMAVQSNQRFVSAIQLHVAILPGASSTVPVASVSIPSARRAESAAPEVTLLQIIATLGTLAAILVAVGGIFTMMVERPTITVPIFLAGIATIVAAICLYVLLAKEAVETGFFRRPHDADPYVPRKYKYEKEKRYYATIGALVSIAAAITLISYAAINTSGVTSSFSTTNKTSTATTATLTSTPMLTPTVTTTMTLTPTSITVTRTP